MAIDTNFIEKLEEKNNLKKIFQIKDNHIIGEINDKFNSFNEMTIKRIAQSIINILNKEKKHEIRIFIGNDGSNKNLKIFEKNIGDVIAFQYGQVYNFENHLPISEAFLKFVNHSTDAFLISIYLHKYNLKNKYALSIYNKKNEAVSTKFLELVLDEYQAIKNTPIEMIQNEVKLLDFDKLLKEYSEMILARNFTNNANHLLKIGIINTSLQNTFVKRILGKNDIAYLVLKPKNKEDKPKKIKFSAFSYHKLKNVEYIIKFSYDFKRLYLYKRNYNKYLYFQYDLIDISDLISFYLMFIHNHNIIQNEKFIPIQDIYTSHLIKEDNLSHLCSQLNLRLITNWITPIDQIQSNNALYFDEESNFYLDNKKNSGFDCFSFLSIIVDMLNYYKTQAMKYSDIYDQIKNLSKPLKISEFQFDCDLKNLNDFETKLFVQDKIGQIKVSAIENISNHWKNKDQKYIAKFHFLENEWLSIKYDFINEKLVFNVQENKKTKGNLAKKIKNFMAKFVAKYHKPLISFKLFEQ
ncbi:Hypothetical protein MAU_5180 [Metamycoplasma auris 15026]|uniref:Uncharacterized protein n=1 Tax=Metamycoplasma auris 15026 TaxID=1188233 RepID=N9TRN8_9BACT|nr:hypothetical protein [Metamycoplasma auris]ENY68720.1 Hypothetical protein MAU_5180 [Metamycoplasma auris 15026]